MSNWLVWIQIEIVSEHRKSAIDIAVWQCLFSYLKNNTANNQEVLTGKVLPTIMYYPQMSYKIITCFAPCSNTWLEFKQNLKYVKLLD